MGELYGLGPEEKGYLFTGILLRPGSLTGARMFPETRWQDQQHLLANIQDILSGIAYGLAGGKGKKPKPVPRPQANKAKSAGRGRKALTKQDIPLIENYLSQPRQPLNDSKEVN